MSRREKEVLDLIAEELTPRQIAEKLCISEKRLRDTARIYWLSFR
ncbi:LuxR C-terminal-related transcriptional regulator [uncultured Roseivirga sp.]